MRFEKFEGLGNDFVLVDFTGDRRAVEARTLDVDEPLAALTNRVSEICDRHRGVGADGVLVMLPARAAGAAATMVVLNADGSRPEMCGNGLRCVAAYLANRVRETRAAGDRDASIELDIDTDAGRKSCIVHGDLVTIDMGSGIDEGWLDLLPDQVAPRSEHDDVIALEKGVSEGWKRWGLLEKTGALKLHKISTGNPHAIMFEPGADADIAFERLGRALTNHTAFEKGSNIEMATMVSPTRIDVRVWERGVGPTLACGTGACATVVAAMLEGRVEAGTEVTVNLPGGALFITVGRNLSIKMRGPARRVFTGALT